MWFRGKRLGTADWVALVVAVVLPLVIMVTYFQQSRPSNGYVRDGEGRSIPGARLRFWGDEGRVVATITADEKGAFRHGDLKELVKRDVDGFALTRVTHDSGMPRVYYFTPLGRHEALFHDTDGKPVAGLAVSFLPSPRTWNTADARKWEEGIVQKTGTDGRATFAGLPTGARLEMHLRDRRYSLREVTTAVEGRIVRYDVTVGSLAAARPIAQNP